MSDSECSSVSGVDEDEPSLALFREAAQKRRSPEEPVASGAACKTPKLTKTATFWSAVESHIKSEKRKAAAQKRCSEQDPELKEIRECTKAAEDLSAMMPDSQLSQDEAAVEQPKTRFTRSIKRLPKPLFVPTAPCHHGLEQIASFARQGQSELKALLNGAWTQILVPPAGVSAEYLRWLLELCVYTTDEEIGESAFAVFCKTLSFRDELEQTCVPKWRAFDEALWHLGISEEHYGDAATTEITVAEYVDVPEEFEALRAGNLRRWLRALAVCLRIEGFLATEEDVVLAGKHVLPVVLDSAVLSHGGGLDANDALTSFVEVVTKHGAERVPHLAQSLHSAAQLPPDQWLLLLSLHIPPTEAGRAIQRCLAVVVLQATVGSFLSPSMDPSSSDVVKVAAMVDAISAAARDNAIDVLHVGLPLVDIWFGDGAAARRSDAKAHDEIVHKISNLETGRLKLFANAEKRSQGKAEEVKEILALLKSKLGRAYRAISEREQQQTSMDMFASRVLAPQPSDREGSEERADEGGTDEADTDPLNTSEESNQDGTTEAATTPDVTPPGPTTG